MADRVTTTIVSGVGSFRAVCPKLLGNDPMQLINTARFIEELSFWTIRLLQRQRRLDEHPNHGPSYR